MNFFDMGAQLIMDPIMKETGKEFFQKTTNFFGVKMAEEVAELSAEILAQKLIEESSKKSGEILIEQVAKKTAQKAAESILTQAAQQTAQKSAEILAKKVIEESAKKSGEILIEQVAEKTANKAAEAILTQAAQQTVYKSAEAISKKVVQTTTTQIASAATKQATKSVSSKIPVIGFFVKIPFVAKDLWKGQYLQASLGLASAVTSTVPGAGTAVSIGLDVISAGVSISQGIKLSKEILELLQQLEQLKLSHRFDYQVGVVYSSPSHLTTEQLNPESIPEEEEKKKEKYKKNIFIRLKKLGGGSQGKIYVAMNLLTKRKYCIKKSQTNKDFTSETAALLMYNHKNILRYEGEIHQLNSNQNWILTELCDMDLNQWFNQKGSKSITLAEIEQFIVDIAQGLYVMHSNGDVHRDLRPPNILYKSKKNEFFIGDLGMVKADRQTITNFQSWMGAQPAFQAPEVCNQSSYSTKSDMFSFGKIIIFLLSKFDQKVSGQKEKDKLKMIKNIAETLIKQDPSERKSIFEVRRELQTVGIELKNTQNGGQQNAKVYNLYYKHPYFYQYI